MRFGVPPRLKLSSLSDVSLLLSPEFDGKKDELLFVMLFTARKSARFKTRNSRSVCGTNSMAEKALHKGTLTLRLRNFYVKSPR